MLPYQTADDVKLLTSSSNSASYALAIAFTSSTTSFHGRCHCTNYTGVRVTGRIAGLVYYTIALAGSLLPSDVDVGSHCVSSESAFQLVSLYRGRRQNWRFLCSRPGQFSRARLSSRFCTRAAYGGVSAALSSCPSSEVQEDGAASQASIRYALANSHRGARTAQ